MKIKCKRCGHIWDYTGIGLVYAKCPKCRFDNPLRGIDFFDNLMKKYSARRLKT